MNLCLKFGANWWKICRSWKFQSYLALKSNVLIQGSPTRGPGSFSLETDHGRLASWIKWRACDAGEAKEGLDNELWRRWSNGRVGELRCDVGKATEGLENELWRGWLDGKIGEWAELILQPFHHFTYVTTYSPNLLSLYLCHSSFSNPSIALPTSQLILQPFHRFIYVTAHSPTLLLLHLHHSSFSNPSVALPTSQHILQPFHCFTYVTAHSPTLLLLYLCHSSFSNPSFASPTSQALHLRHLVSRPW